MNNKPRRTEKTKSGGKKKCRQRRPLNTQEYKEKVMLDFMIACGNIHFIKSIAAGKDVSRDSVIAEAAKTAVEDWKKAPPLRGCYDPYRSWGECIQSLTQGGARIIHYPQGHILPE